MPTTKSTKDTKFAAKFFAAFVAGIAFILLTTTVTTFAQCAMCKANIAGAENSAEVSRTINTGVLVLLIPTLAIIGGVVRLILKYRH